MKHIDSKKYLARMNNGACAEFDTVRECRQWAQTHGNTADRCTIETTARGHIIAAHRRDTAGNGRHWYRCVPA